MNELDIDMAWQNLRQAVNDLENMNGDMNVLVATMEAGVELLMDFPPRQIVAKAEASELPTRAVISWLVFESGRIEGIDPAKGRALKDFWNGQAPEDQAVMKAPPGAGLY